MTSEICECGAKEYESNGVSIITHKIGCEKFKPKSEICVKCGLLEKFHPVWSLTNTERVLCKKFKPKFNFHTAMDKKMRELENSFEPQNHSPQTKPTHDGMNISFGADKTEDTEPEEASPRKASGSGNHSPIAPVRTEDTGPDASKSSGSGSLSDTRWLYEGREGCPVYWEIKVKEAVKKLKDELDNNIVFYIDPDEDEFKRGEIKIMIDKIFGEALV